MLAKAPMMKHATRDDAAVAVTRSPRTFSCDGHLCRGQALAHRYSRGFNLLATLAWSGGYDAECSALLSGPVDMSWRKADHMQHAMVCQRAHHTGFVAGVIELAGCSLVRALRVAGNQHQL